MFITPRPLVDGDTIAILSPASTVNPDFVADAASRLEAEGFKVRIMPHALGPADGSYASTAAKRLSDLHEALSDSEVRAILCSRGGYGAVHLLDKIPAAEIVRDPKWLIGFSDISVLHALFHRNNVCSLHAPMAKHIASATPYDFSYSLFSLFLRILRGKREFIYDLRYGRGSQLGYAEGYLVGGNLAVLEGLAGTPWDILASPEPKILFIEDVGEAIYRTERMLWRLYLSGALSRIKGLIVGRFTETRPDANYPDTLSMICDRLSDWHLDIPIVTDFPVGHTDFNLPMPIGAHAELSVTLDNVKLKLSI